MPRLWRHGPARSLAAAAVLVLALLPVGVSPAQEEELPYPVVTLSDGVYAILQPDALRFNDSNVVVIINREYVMLVDAPGDPAAAQAVADWVRRRTDRPVRYVVFTHWHTDHTQGGDIYRKAFGPSIVFIGHSSQRDDIVQRAEPMMLEDIGRYETGIAEARERLAALEAEERDEEAALLLARIEAAEERLGHMRSTDIPVPDITLDTELTLHDPERTVRIMHFKAHTRGDLVVHLPEEKILVTGDMVDDLPFGGHGYPESWIAAIRELEELDVKHLVPGHGRVREGKAHLGLIRRFLEAIQSQVLEGVAQEKPLEEIQEGLQLDRFRQELGEADDLARRMFGDFVAETAKRMHQAATVGVE